MGRKSKVTSPTPADSAAATAAVPTTTQEYHAQISEAADFIREKLGPADIGVVLGSGLSMFADYLEGTASVSFEEIPHMPRPTVAMHAGKVTAGRIGDKRIHLYVGRLHWYEGHLPHIVTFATRIMKQVGVRILMLTNAAGGSQKGMYVGCPMVLTDHLNFHFRSPLGDNGAEDPRVSAAYVDTKGMYSRRLVDLARSTAKELDQPLFSGIYCMSTGPLFETPLETNNWSKLGADAFGMSTVPEACAAHALGMEVFAMSMITNLAAGISDQPLSHEEVGEAAKEAGPAFAKLLKGILERVTLPAEDTTVRAAPAYEVPLLGNTLTLVNRDSAQLAADSMKDLPSSASLALFLAPQHADFVETLKGRVEWALAGLPNMPQRGTASGRHGKLVWGTTEEGVPVFVVVQRRQEGFDKDEAQFVVEVLKCLGVRAVGSTVVGMGTGSKQLEAGAIIPITEFSNGTTANYAAQKDFPVRPFCHKATAFVADEFKTGVPTAKKTKMACCGGDSATQIPQLSYKWFAGPTLPTEAEVELAKFGNNALAGICGLHAILSACEAGLDTFSIATVSSREDIASCSTDQRQFDALSSVVNHFSETAVLAAPSRLSTVSEPAVPGASVAVTRTERNQTTFQHPWEETNAAADYLLGKIGRTRATFPLTIVVKKNMEWLNLVQDYLDKRVEVPYSEVPHMPAEITARSSEAKFVFGFYEETPLLMVYGVNNSGEGSPSATGFVMRALGMAGMKQMIVVGTVFGNDPANMKNGDLVYVEDSTNMTGWNPLFGKNEDRYGLRFTDMGTAYDPNMRTVATKAAEAVGVTANPVKLACINGTIYMSESEAHHFMEFDMQVTSTGIVPEIQLAHHHGTRKAALCMVDMGEGGSFDDFSSALNPLTAPVAHLHVHREAFTKWLWETIRLISAEDAAAARASQSH